MRNNKTLYTISSTEEILIHKKYHVRADSIEEATDLWSEGKADVVEETEHPLTTEELFSVSEGNTTELY